MLLDFDAYFLIPERDKCTRICLSIFSILHFWKWLFIVIYTDKRPNRPTQHPISYPMHFAPRIEVQPRCGQSQEDAIA